MSLYKRQDMWHIDITTPNGNRIRRSANTADRKAAKEYHDRIKAESWRTDKLKEAPEHTWDEAALRFLRESEGKASLKDYKRQIGFWTTHFRGRVLGAITRSAAADLVESHAHTPGTRNRYIACLRAVLMKAAGPWEWAIRCPKFKTYSEPTQRIRWLTEEEARMLVDALPDWVAQMARFALATGLRQSNVYTLEWRQIDLARRVAWVEADQAKAGAPIGIPLNTDAMKVLNAQLGKHTERVFLDEKGQLMDFWPFWARRSFDIACSNVKITNFRWHDLRHTWASWHVQRGTPLYNLKELGGWKTLEIVKRYAHLAPEHLMEHAERVSFNFTSQARHSSGDGNSQK
jgi:integrase